MENFKTVTFKESKKNYGIPYILKEAKNWYDSNKDSIEEIHSSFTTELDDTTDEIIYRRALVLRYREKGSTVESEEESNINESAESEEIIDNEPEEEITNDKSEE
jgi:hypothetical protein